MSDQTEAQAAPQETTPEAPAQDNSIFDQINGRLDELSAPLSEMQQWVQSQQQPQEDPYAYQEPDPYGAQVDEYGNPVQQQQGLTPQQVQEMVAQQMAPMQQQFRQQEINGLAEKYPEMRNPEVIQALDQSLGRMAQLAGNPDLATHPYYVEQAFKAYRADQLASQQTPAGNQSEVQLEQSGATPPAQEQDPGDQMFGPRRAAPSGPFGDWAVR